MTAGSRRPVGVTGILAATAVSGACGYVVTMIVGASKTPADYVGFSVFWAGLYLVIAALSGLQQEVSRATSRGPAPDASPSPAAGPSGSPASGSTRPSGSGATRSSSRFTAITRFGLCASLVVAAVILATAPGWAPPVFDGNAWPLAIPLAVGAASYVVVAVICGIMYGLGLWTAIAGMIGIDGILRLIAVVVVLSFTTDTVALAWAVVAPFPLTPAVLWFFVRRRMARQSVLDVGYRRLVWNAARTVVAAAATGLLVSGFPLLLTTMSPDAPQGQLGAVLFSITLVRAPLVIVFLALQSYFVVHFRSVAERSWPLLAKLLALVAAITVVLAAVAWAIGPWVLSWFGPGYALDGPFLAGLIGTSGLLAMVCVTGPFVLARARHGVFLTGWLVAAIACILVLLAPGDLVGRTLLSLGIGALLGVAVHVAGAAIRPGSVRAAAD